MTHALLLIALLADPLADARFTRYFHFLAEGGGVPSVEKSGHLGTSVDWGLYPFDGAFSTGMSAQLGAAITGPRWVLFQLGLFARLDLTWLLLTGFWRDDGAPDRFPFRVQVGSRLGIDWSQSTLTLPGQEGGTSYTLLRPVLHSFLDLQLPLPGHDWGQHAVFVRASVDTPVNLSTVIRWGLSVGFALGYGEAT
ncbi:MAG: hypothetical protein IPJ65_37520 [Archangiaceae bacterium]|nr:hypothetical protein [Archangiaceae bacterium]